MNQNIILGCIIGFFYFLYKLESPGMGNVLFRTNSNGFKVFSFDSLINIILAPFRYIFFWTNTDLYPVNWLITTFIGGLIASTLYSS